MPSTSTNVLLNESAATGTVTGDEYFVRNNKGRETANFSVQIGSPVPTTGVALQGRNHDSDSWVAIKETITASELFVGALFNRLRVVVTGGAGGSVRVSSDIEVETV